jgi:hypothetical protein
MIFFWVLEEKRPGNLHGTRTQITSSSSSSSSSSLP